MGSSGELTPDAAAQMVAVCACFNMRRASRAVTRHFDAAMASTGLRSTQFVLLVGIRAQGQSTLQTLARDLGVERSALARRLVPLEKRGLLRIQPSRSGDRRR